MLMNRSSFAAIVLSVFAACSNIFAQQPEFQLDTDWPKIPFGENWLTGGLGGMCVDNKDHVCLLYTSPSPRDLSTSRMPSSA